MSILRRVERELDERIRRLFAPGSGAAESREVLEIQRGILDEITGRVQAVGRGRRVFQFRRLVVHLAAPPGERSLYTVAFAEGDRLSADIREALREAGAEVPPDLRVEVALEEGAQAGFRIAYHEQGAAPTAAPAVRLVVLEGETAQPEYTVSGGRINIGRLPEVLDDQQRLVRRNQVAFAEGAGPVTASVSRAHAHIRYDPASGEYRIYDDHSAYGTSVFRDGALLGVPAGAGRGMALRPGDEIYFGQARARFELA